jgi:hypothetical protein
VLPQLSGSYERALAAVPLAVVGQYLSVASFVVIFQKQHPPKHILAPGPGADGADGAIGSDRAMERYCDSIASDQRKKRCFHNNTEARARGRRIRIGGVRHRYQVSGIGTKCQASVPSVRHRYQVSGIGTEGAREHKGAQGSRYTHAWPE